MLASNYSMQAMGFGGVDKVISTNDGASIKHVGGFRTTIAVQRLVGCAKSAVPPASGCDVVALYGLHSAARYQNGTYQSQ